MDVIEGIKRYRRTVGLRGLLSALRGKITNTCSLFEVNKPELMFRFVLRVPSTDIATFEQIFVRQDYAFDVCRAPKTIVDAGANVGLASLYFANRFPEATIIAVEPEESNVNVLRQNTAPYGNIRCMCAALWHKRETLRVVDPGLGQWAFRTQAQEVVGPQCGKRIREVQGMTVNAIMEQHGISHIDILKIDIEGAEKEVFEDPSCWIEKVDALIIELHDFIRPGCSRNVYRWSSGFSNEWRQGENVYLTKSGSCVTTAIQQM